MSLDGVLLLREPLSRVLVHDTKGCRAEELFQLLSVGVQDGKTKSQGTSNVEFDKRHIDHGLSTCQISAKIMITPGVEPGIS